MRQRRDNMRGPLRVLLASVIAAPIAYYFSVGNLSPNLAPTADPAHESGLASFAARLVASSEFPAAKDQLRPGEAEAYNTVVSDAQQVDRSSRRLPPAARLPPQPDSSRRRGEGRVAAEPGARSGRARPPAGARARCGVHQAPHAAGRAIRASGDLVAARLVYRGPLNPAARPPPWLLGATSIRWCWPRSE